MVFLFLLWILALQQEHPLYSKHHVEKDANSPCVIKYNHCNYNMQCWCHHVILVPVTEIPWSDIWELHSGLETVEHQPVPTHTKPNQAFMSSQEMFTKPHLFCPTPQWDSTPLCIKQGQKKRKLSCGEKLDKSRGSQTVGWDPAVDHELIFW